MTAAVTHPHHFTVEEFLALCGTDPDRWRRFELVNGEIWEPMPESVAHARLVESIAASLRERYASSDSRVWTNGSVRLDGDGLPLPDVYVVRAGEAPTGDYWSGRQLVLAVEVSLSTQAHDLGPKMTNYARGGVPHYFAVQLDEDGEPFARHYFEAGRGRYRSMVECAVEDIHVTD